MKDRKRPGSSLPGHTSLSLTDGTLGWGPKLLNIYTFGGHSRSKLQYIGFGSLSRIS